MNWLHANSGDGKIFGKILKWEIPLTLPENHKIVLINGKRYLVALVPDKKEAVVLYSQAASNKFSFYNEVENYLK
jgi:hypothetical protein